MAEEGWRRLHVTIVQVAPIDRVLADLPARDDLVADVAPVPSADWLSLMHDLDDDDPEAHVAILTGPDRVGFVTLRRDGEPVGIGRVSVEGEWAGVTSVDVAPAARRQGIGSAVMGELLRWAQAAGRLVVVPAGAGGEPRRAPAVRRARLRHPPPVLLPRAVVG